jgi:hypothetical protein
MRGRTKRRNAARRRRLGNVRHVLDQENVLRQMGANWGRQVMRRHDIQADSSSAFGQAVGRGEN